MFLEAFNLYKLIPCKIKGVPLHNPPRDRNRKLHAAAVFQLAIDQKRHMCQAYTVDKSLVEVISPVYSLLSYHIFVNSGGLTPIPSFNPYWTRHGTEDFLGPTFLAKG